MKRTHFHDRHGPLPNPHLVEAKRKESSPDPIRSRELLALVREQLNRHLARVFETFLRFGLDMGDGADRELVALMLDIKPHALRSYVDKIRKAARPFLDDYRALLHEKFED